MSIVNENSKSLGLGSKIGRKKWIGTEKHNTNKELKLKKTRGVKSKDDNLKENLRETLRILNW